MPTSLDILNARVLIVDDQEVNVLLLERMLRGAGYSSVTSTTDPARVCELHLANRYDLILLDLQMPGLDGFEVMEGLRQIEPDGYLPVLVVTAQPGHKLRALQAGARDFVSKPFELPEVLARVRNMVEMRLWHKALHASNEDLERRVRERTAELRESYLETILTLTRAAEQRDEDTGSHVHRISFYCRRFAGLLGLDEEFGELIACASPMHDVGKIGIPDHILLKPGSFTPEESKVMQGHTTIGWKILGDSRSPLLTMGAEIALNHHERWDGGGYPNGKRGEAIPLPARIMSLCDVYDALRSRRPYKPGFGHPRAVDIMTRGDGRTLPEHFDPALLALFARHHEMFAAIFEGCDE